MSDWFQNYWYPIMKEFLVSKVNAQCNIIENVNNPVIYDVSVDLNDSNDDSISHFLVNMRTCATQMLFLIQRMKLKTQNKERKYYLG